MLLHKLIKKSKKKKNIVTIIKAARGEMIFKAHNGFYIRNYFYFLNNNYKIMDGLSQIVATAANKVQKFTSTFSLNYFTLG